ncbi:EF-hand domain-containing protein [Streptomyces sp. NPDC093249]|uniref:EF-hand domain-containing protein n=1 Tax=unclassified Streptomyces TaxID=2593676 RepID=UPI0038289FA3
MSQDLLIRKIRHGFDRFDVDESGDLTEADHVLMGQRSARALGLPPGSDGERRIVDAYVGIWRNLHVPHLPPGVESMTREQFVESTLSLADDPEAAKATLGALAEVFLSVADADGDGVVDPEEHLCFLRGHFPQVTREEADTVFRHLDRDGDGTLSREEFTSAVIEYWTSTDPHAPGNWWIGAGFTE